MSLYTLMFLRINAMLIMIMGMMMMLSTSHSGPYLPFLEDESENHSFRRITSFTCQWAAMRADIVIK